MHLTRRTLLTAAGAAGLAACSSKSAKPKNRNVDKVTALTGFNITGQDSFLFAGLEKGWYREAGIDLAIQPGAGTGRNLAQVNADAAQFAIIDLTGGLLEMDRGGPAAQFKVFATIYQRNVSCIVALPRSGIKSPRDLVGRKVGFTEGGVNKTIFPAYARLSGFTDSDVKWQSMAPTAIRPALIAGQLDAATEIVVGRPALEAAAGQAVTVLPYSDVMGDLFGNALAVSTKLAGRNPDLVRRFRDATMRALTWTIENPDEAGRIMNKRNPAYKAEVATAEVRQTIPYVRGNAPVIGFLDPVRLSRSIALVQSIGLVKPGLTAENVAALDLTPKP